MPLKKHAHVDEQHFEIVAPTFSDTADFFYLQTFFGNNQSFLFLYALGKPKFTHI